MSEAQAVANNTHDYTDRVCRWGYDIIFHPVTDDGVHAYAIGWGRGIEPGHFILLSNGPDRTTRYRVESIDYYRDPPDMWKGAVVFAPRPTGEER